MVVDGKWRYWKMEFGDYTSIFFNFVKYLSTTSVLWISADVWAVLTDEVA